MLVLHFAFAESLKNPQQLGADDTNRIVYTGTHDNDTSLGWWETASRAERRRVDEALAAFGLEETEPSWKLIALALHNAADIALIPAQDILGLGSDARLNTPGKASGNWSWQLEPAQLTPQLAERLRALTVASGRTGG
jgi:4-alpha-glucanotransferase